MSPYLFQIIMKPPINIENIILCTCEYFNITIEQFHFKTRKREIVQSRQIAMYFAKNLTKTSVFRIGIRIGNKNHATVSHSCKTITNLIKCDKEIKKYVYEIEKILMSKYTIEKKQVLTTSPQN